MSNRPNSRALRNFAEGFFDGLVGQGRILESEKDDFVTSMVRQWITYDGNATWFFGEEQVYFVHRHTPLGKPLLETTQRQPAWFAEMRQDWKIEPEEFPGVIEQLNRGQSAEVTNTEGVPLRLWVNPKERSSGVEPLATQPRSRRERDYRVIATKSLVKHLEIVPDEQELEALSCSVAMMWQKFQGHASIFLDRGRQLVLKLVEQSDGGCQVGASNEKGDLGPLLISLGFDPDRIPEVIAHINLGQAIEFRNREGVVSILRHDPKEKKILVHPKSP
jgi:hypothetical protein